MTGTRPLRRALAWGLLHSGALRLRRPRFEKGRAILLLYHRVNDEGDPFFPGLPRRIFAAQLAYIAANYRVDPLAEVAAWLADGAAGPPRVAITIDDGYPDTLEVVVPELERRGLPATLLLSTAPPETGQPLWIDRTRWILKHARAPAIDLPSVGLRGRLEGTPERLGLLGPLLRRLKALGPEEIEGCLGEVEAALAPEGPPVPVLSWEDVRRMTQGPMTLGAHTHRHYMLSRLSDAALWEEVATSVRLIESRTGIRPTSFAYPNGERPDYDARAIDVLRRQGLTCAVTCRHGLARAGEDPYQLPRLFTKEPSLAVFAARLAGLGREARSEVEVS